MSTTLAKKETVVRKWYLLDAAGRPLGRTAVIAANILRGKHKPDWTPNVDCGDFVIIINTAKAELTGKKLEQKFYRRHSGWVGGLKETKYKYIMEKRPDFAMSQAVKGMMSKNTRDRLALKRLRVFKDAEHIHEAQKPEVWNEPEVEVFNYKKKDTVKDVKKSAPKAEKAQEIPAEKNSTKEPNGSKELKVPVEKKPAAEKKPPAEKKAPAEKKDSAKTEKKTPAKQAKKSESKEEEDK